MKKFFIIFILFGIITIQLRAQNWPIDPVTKRITFTAVVNVDSVSKDELYLRVKEWFAKTYNDSKEVIQMDDKESGKIIGKGSIEVFVHSLGLKPYGYVKYVITVNVKDSRFKYEISNFIHEWAATNGGGGTLENEKPACGTLYLTKGYWATIKEQVYADTNTIIGSLKKGMLKASAQENW